MTLQNSDIMTSELTGFSKRCLYTKRRNGCPVAPNIVEIDRCCDDLDIVDGKLLGLS